MARDQLAIDNFVIEFTITPPYHMQYLIIILTIFW